MLIASCKRHLTSSYNSVIIIKIIIIIDNIYFARDLARGGGVARLRRHGLNRLPRGIRMRKVHTKRYQKQVPGHDMQMDVKFLTFISKKGEKV